MRTKTKSFLLAFSLLLTVTANAQVTIGSDNQPNVGSLLDLKESSGTSTTSSKGFGFPRVKLTDLTKLKMGDVEITDTQDAGSQYAKHVGLIVYHQSGVTPYECADIVDGLYMWDGTKWQTLQNGSKPDQTSFDAASGILTDYEGNKYTTKVFTGPSYSKRWMTQNLRSIRGKDGKVIDCNRLRFNPAYRENPNVGVTVQGKIPNGLVNNYIAASIPISGQSYTDFVKEFGFLYTEAQANKACPRGWHLPTIAEFGALFLSIGAGQRAGSQGGPEYTGIAHQMKKNNNTLYKSVDDISMTWGIAGTTENGFNAVPSGNMNTTDQNVSAFVIAMFWWTGSTGSYFALYAYDPDILYRATSITGNNHRISVRCVQD